MTHEHHRDDHVLARASGAAGARPGSRPGAGGGHLRRQVLLGAFDRAPGSCSVVATTPSPVSSVTSAYFGIR